MSVRKRRRAERVQEAIDVAFKDSHLRNLRQTRWGLALTTNQIFTMMRRTRKW